MIKSSKFSVQNYGSCNLEVYIPDGLTTTAACVVFIPGNGEVGTDKNKLYVNGPLKFIKAGWKPNFIVAAIQPLYGFAGAPFVNAGLQELSKPDYKASSFSLTGLSGGAGSIMSYMAQTKLPVPIKAIAPMSFNFDDGPVNQTNYKDVATWIFCGTNDGGHYTSMMKSLIQLKAWGFNARATWYPDGHAGWNKFYDNAWKDTDGETLYNFLTSAKGGTVTPPVVVPPVTPPTTPPVTPPVIPPATGTTKTYNGTGTDKGVYISSGINPGDTLLLKGKFDYFSLGGIKGTKEKPVLIFNDGLVELKSGFGFDDCEYVYIVAQKTPIGFVVSNPADPKKGTGVSINKKSAHIKVLGVEVFSKNYGCLIKNEAQEDDSINYPNWWLDDILVQDCYFHDLDSQGFYMGSTDPNNLDRPITINGKLEYPDPTRLSNIRILNNIVKNTGRPGIQLSGAMRGENEIAFNDVSNTGLQMDDAQGTGISLGGYTRGKIHDNKIRNTLTWGIASLGGSGLLEIYNNDIDDTGVNSKGTLKWPSAIHINTATTDPVDLTTFVIKNNKVGKIGSEQTAHITVDKRFDTYTKDNVISGNTTQDGNPAVAKIESGIVVNGTGTTTPPVTPPPVTPTKTIIKTITLTVYSDGSIDIK